ncbi:hypothetical protein V2G26_003342 [Clonostachys chloroleuca]
MSRLNTTVRFRLGFTPDTQHALPREDTAQTLLTCGASTFSCPRVVLTWLDQDSLVAPRPFQAVFFHCYLACIPRRIITILQSSWCW